MVLEYHRRAGVRVPSLVAHAAVHVAVESQAAMGDELPVRRAIDRLMAEGVDRHEAIHAVGSVLTDHLSDAMKQERPVSMEAYQADVERLTVEFWRRNFGSDSEADDS